MLNTKMTEGQTPAAVGVVVCYCNTTKIMLSNGVIDSPQYISKA